MIKSIQETFTGFAKAKTTSIPTQNVDLYSQLLVFTKNEFPAWIIMKKTQKFGKETLSKSQLREERKNTLSNPQNINLCYVFTQQYQKRVFLATHTLGNPKNDFSATHTSSKTPKTNFQWKKNGADCKKCACENGGWRTEE